MTARVAWTASNASARSRNPWPIRTTCLPRSTIAGDSTVAAAAAHLEARATRLELKVRGVKER